MVYTDPDEVPWSAYLALTGVAVVIVAALLPWFEVLGDPTTGFQHDDGYLTAGVAVATATFLLAFEWDLVARTAAVLAGGLSLLVGYNVWQQVADYGTDEPGSGLYLTVLGGGLLLIAALWGTVEARRPAAPSEGTGARKDEATPTGEDSP